MWSQQLPEEVNAALKYWAFLISLYGFLYDGLSVRVLLAVGLINLVFAVLFTRYLLSKRA